MTEYEVSRPVGRCHVSGRTFTDQDEFFSALFETAQGFERRDYAPECWQGQPAEAMCSFKTRLPRREEQRKVFIDNDALIGFFLRLAEEADAAKLRFRFVLSLILLRKRLLKYERTLRDDAGEFWEMRLMRDKSIQRVFNPALEESEIEDLTAQLGAILAGFSTADDDPVLEGEVPAPTAQPGEPP